jgi:hypothetical protein
MRGLVAGSQIISTALVGAGIGAGIGAAIGAVAILGLIGLFAGFAGGIALVRARFRDL